MKRTSLALRRLLLSSLPAPVSEHPWMVLLEFSHGGFRILSDPHEVGAGLVRASFFSGSLRQQRRLSAPYIASSDDSQLVIGTSCMLGRWIPPTDQACRTSQLQRFHSIPRGFVHMQRS
ncbi:hypothetical protein EE085_29285, partial [Klebsiella pneumoniae]|nr:hypothetical protein [Klebsiella pneumoniae]